MSAIGYVTHNPEKGSYRGTLKTLTIIWNPGKLIRDAPFRPPGTAQSGHGETPWGLFS